jgi:hypothetical protein
MLIGAKVGVDEFRTVRLGDVVVGDILLRRSGHLCFVVNWRDPQGNTQLRLAYLTGDNAFGLRRDDQVEMWVLRLGNVREPGGCRLVIEVGAEPQPLVNDLRPGAIIFQAAGMSIWVQTAHDGFSAFRLADLAEDLPENFRHCWVIERWKLHLVSSCGEARGVLAEFPSRAAQA